MHRLDRYSTAALQRQQHWFFSKLRHKCSASSQQKRQPQLQGRGAVEIAGRTRQDMCQSCAEQNLSRYLHFPLRGSRSTVTGQRSVESQEAQDCDHTAYGKGKGAHGHSAPTEIQVDS